MAVFRYAADQGAGSGNPAPNGSTGGEGAGSFLTGKGQKTDTQGATPPATDQGAAGAGSTTTVAPLAPGKATPPAWKAQLPKDLQSDEAADRFPNIGEVWKAYRELEGKVGKAVIRPEKGAPKEEWDRYHQQNGRPEKPEDYKLERLKDLPPGLEYTDDKEYRKTAHELGLSADQAGRFYEFLNQQYFDQYKAAIAASEKAQEKVIEDLRKEWGKDFDANTALMRRAVETFGTPEALGIIEKYGLSNDPHIARLFFKIGKAMGEGAFLEGGATGNPGGGFDYPGIE